MPNQTMRGWISDYILLIILAVLLSYLWMSAPDARRLQQQDVQALDQVQAFNREPMPERVNHTKRSGTYGTLTVTNDVTPYGLTHLLSKISEQTETFESFSAMAAERGGDKREVQVFPLKFDIEEGKEDMTGNTISVFFVRDPWAFTHSIHTQKHHSQTHLLARNMQRDIGFLYPESLHQVMSDSRLSGCHNPIDVNLASRFLCTCEAIRESKRRTQMMCNGPRRAVRH